MEERKIAVVSGATGGMGREIVRDLSRDHRVYALGRSADDLAGWEGVEPVTIDLAADLDKGYHLPDIGRVDVLVHAAARAEKLSVASARPADWRRQMDLNVLAAAELTRLLLPGLRAAGGTAVFVNSGAGRRSYADNVVYAATKHALYALADALRLSEPLIRVATVAPGPTDTAMLRGLRDYDLAEVIAPVEIARAVRAIVAAGPSAQITEVQVRPRNES